MAYDSVHNQAVLFGGTTPPPVKDFGDTWTWDGANWTQESPQTLPSPRIYSAMAYDSAHDQVVLFGGFEYGTFLNDTWLWDGSNWTQASPQTSPSGRDGIAMAYDSAHSQVVLFAGGIATDNLVPLPGADTWTWSGGPLLLLSPPS